MAVSQQLHNKRGFQCFHHCKSIYIAKAQEKPLSKMTKLCYLIFSWRGGGCLFPVCKTRREVFSPYTSHENKGFTLGTGIREFKGISVKS